MFFKTVIAVLMLYHSSISNSMTLDELIRNGTRLEWVYERGGVLYYMTPNMQADVIDSARQRFNVTIVVQEPITTTAPTTEESAEPPTEVTTTTNAPCVPNPDKYFTVFQISASQFVAVQNNTLGKGGSPDEFILTRVACSERSNEFYLMFNDEPFVAPRTRAPFDFFLKSEFPAEPAVVFSLLPYKFHLNSSYAGNRENIVSTLDEIVLLNLQADRSAAFTDLIIQMDNNNHITGGSEIFIVGRYIQLYLTNYLQSMPYQMLPEQVQLVLQGSSPSYPLQLTLTTDSGQLIPMNEHTASTVVAPFYPYTITFLISRSKVSITSGTGRSLSLSNGNLVSSLIPSEFEIHFPPNSTDYFLIRSSSEGYLHYNESGNQYMFCTCDSLGPVARFTVSRFEVDVPLIYGLENRQDIPKVAHIIQKYALGSAIGQRFELLLQLMQQFEHMSGKEVFSVGRFMVDLLDSMDPVFGLLPATVWLVSSANLSWSFVTESGESFPMKYSWSSDLHTGIEPYTFRASNLGNTTIVQFAIVYSVIAGQRQRIFIDPNTKQLTQRILSGNLQYEFELSLMPDLDSFAVFWNGTQLGTFDQVPDFYFETYNQTHPAPARFKISEY